MSDTMRAWVEIDLCALARNGAALAARAGVPILPMVKADAYGLGAVPVVRALETVRPWGYGVATVEEGAELRAAAIERPVLVFTPLLPSDIAAARAARLVPTLGSRELIAAWGTASHGSAWHLAIDTGMGRSGVRWNAVDALADLLRAFPPAGACTHFYAADHDDDSAARQLRRFEAALAAMPVRPAVLHVESSAAIERLAARSVWTVVRPGIFLYGVASRVTRADAPERDTEPTRSAGSGAGATPTGRPADRGRVLVPEPVVSLRARVVDLRTIEAGETVSYGGTFEARTPRRIATVPVGYGDGYRRAFGNVGAAILRGQRVPVVGMVTMDMTMLDVSDVDCRIGDIVTMLGPAPALSSGAAPATIDLVDAAREAGVFPYELLTGLRLRLPRVYVDGPPCVDSGP
jgi:alanine racemase